jgi:ferredoxin
MVDVPKFEKDRYIIEYDREGCIGAASCVAVDPVNWKLADSDGKADFIKQTIDSQEELQKAIESAESCPVVVIHILDKKTGKRLI